MSPDAYWWGRCLVTARLAILYTTHAEVSFLTYDIRYWSSVWLHPDSREMCKSRTRVSRQAGQVKGQQQEAGRETLTWVTVIENASSACSSSLWRSIVGMQWILLHSDVSDMTLWSLGILTSWSSTSLVRVDVSIISSWHLYLLPVWFLDLSVEVHTWYLHSSWCDFNK